MGDSQLLKKDCSAWSPSVCDFKFSSLVVSTMIIAIKYTHLITLFILYLRDALLQDKAEV
jgi:hypothetical protein